MKRNETHTKKTGWAELTSWGKKITWKITLTIYKTRFKRTRGENELKWRHWKWKAVNNHRFSPRNISRLRVFNMPPQENSKQITLYTIQPCSAIEFIDFAIKFDSFAGHYVFTILAHFSLSSSNCSAAKWFLSGKPQPMMKNACSVKMHEYLNGYGKKERENKRTEMSHWRNL